MPALLPSHRRPLLLLFGALLSLALLWLPGCGPAARGDAQSPSLSEGESAGENALPDTSVNIIEAVEGPIEPIDPCAAFNERQATIDAEAHMNTYGCPPCPCACINGEVTCAPCALCEPEEKLLAPDGPSATPKEEAKTAP